MRIVGYGDRLSVAPGERIGFRVSCHDEDYEAAIVRLIHGDPNPRGPGFREVEVEGIPTRPYPGRVQDIPLGSYVRVEHAEALAPDQGQILSCWVYPTTPGKGRQGLLTKWSEDGPSGFGLFLDETGNAELRLAIEDGTTTAVTSAEPLAAGAWSWLEAGFSPAEGEAWLRTVAHHRAVPSLDSTVRVALTGHPAHASEPFLMGAYAGNGDVRGHFNGKLDAPQIARCDRTPIARWDCSQHIPSRRVAEVVAGLDGVAVNMPMRAVTGHNWTGRDADWRVAPEQYGAIFFHDDDLEDAAWKEDFALEVPGDLHSGIYAARLRCAGGEDYVPFFVRPPRGSKTADVCLLVPTFSYLAYANEQATKHHTQTDVDQDALQEQDLYGIAAGLKSLYDIHADGAGYCFSTRLRPIINMRPKYNLALIGGPHQFNADLHLADWLEAEGCAFDVVTDEDLHAEGHGLIDGYRAVLTGTHPEYVSWEILDALESYTERAGRLIYLGANGFYWVTSVDPERPHVIEVRRGGRGGTWRNAPGEYHHATTGELGGLWRERGRAPQRLVGVGSAGMGFERALPFRPEPASAAPDAAFIFAGVDEDAVIGADGLVLGGAGGHELDRADYALGTPAHALVVATASGFTDAYQPFTEEVMIIDGKQGAATNPNMRADVVFFALPGGGAVFSAGSMCWCACLSQNGYDNALARMTGNVLRRFRDPAPFEHGGRA